MLKFFTRIRILMWILLLVGVGFLVSTQVRLKLAQAQQNLRSLETQTETVYPVETETVTSTNWETWRSYYGQAKSAHTQNITTYEREIVRTVNVDVGSPVKAGQTVITLQVAARGAQVQSGKTAYDEALLNYNRLKQLNAKGGISKSEVDAAYSRVKTAEAALKSTQSSLQRTTLKASINGIVSARNVEPGEIAEAGAVLLSIVDPKTMEAELMVSKKDVTKINRGTQVEIYVDGEKHTGTVKRISPEAQAGSGLYPVIVGLPENSGILPGTYVEGRFRVSSQTNVVVIPSNVIIYRGSTQSVYLADGNKAKLTAITTGEGRDGKVIVTSGLKPGDALITSGNRVLYDGAGIVRNVGIAGRTNGNNQGNSNEG
ncbi:MAG: efflux RND transporter periplasmic adaptor subunit [Synergistaceae bacterium]|nr:efflux RND transporter periplasmic adaptor subunit [Synergistaceae bacterium]